MNSAIKRQPLKNIVLVLILVSCMVLSLVSCATKSSFEDETEEYDYALSYALSSANESAISNLYFKITQSSCFLSDSLAFLQNSASEIPGMPKLLSEWTTYMNSYNLQWFEDLRSYLNSLSNAMVFSDPIEIVEQSDDSASTNFENTYGEEIKIYVRQNLSKVDLSKWEELKSQYKAWVETRKVLFDEDNTQLENVDLLDEIASYICNLYFTSLKASEVLLRTTPDPNADETVSKVFGLN